MEKYKPITAVWEITMGCNMRCKHCGSICEEALEGELNTAEAFALCDDFKRLGMKYITLSGGEPTVRKDWHLIVEKLNKVGVEPRMITNGWLLDSEIINKAEEAGLKVLAISIDGLKTTHDYMRKKDSFRRDIEALNLIKVSKIKSAVITTVNKRTLEELEELKNVFIENGVETWQLQLALPMGTFKQHKDLFLEPDDVDRVLDFAYECSKEGKIRITLADCIGYYDIRSMEIRKNSFKDSYIWSGCGAGKHSFGILHNGDIVGCTSMREGMYIEGNIRTTNLYDIWNDGSKFLWNRNLTKKDLAGNCKECIYGDLCLGGCANTRTCQSNTVYSGNDYCIYSNEINKLKEYIEELDSEELTELFYNYLEDEAYQLAYTVFTKLKSFSTDIRLQKNYAFVLYMLGRYDDALELNQELLKESNEDWYLYKGIGLSLVKLNKFDEGINMLYQGMKFADKKNMDIYYDTYVTLIKLNRNDEAKEVLINAEKIDSGFLGRYEII